MKAGLFKIFLKFGKYNADYRAIKDDGEKRDVSGLFGRRAIYNTVGTVVLLAAAFGLAALGFAGLD